MLWCLVLQGKTQKLWTLSECIQEALNNNIGVKQSELDIKIAAENVRQSKGALLPSLNANATNNYNFGQRIDPFTNEFASTRVRSNSFSLNTSVDLFNGFQNQRSIQQQHFNYEASKYRSERIKNDLALQVANTFLQILLNQELLQLAKNQRDLSIQQVQQRKVLVDAGSLTEGDLLTIESQLAQEELNVTNNENQLHLGVLRLKQLMLFDLNEEFLISFPNLEQITPNIENQPISLIYENALQQMPIIKDAEYQLKSSEKSIQIAKGQQSPSLLLGASYGTGYSGAREQIIGAVFAGQSQIGTTTTGIPVVTDNYQSLTETVPFGDQLENNLNQTIGLSLIIPIFNGFSTRSTIARARLQNERASYQLEQTKIDLRNDIETAHADARIALKNYEANEKALTSMEKSFEYSQKRFENGLMTAVEFNTEKNNLFRTKSQLIQAKYDFVFKMKILDFFQGKPLSL
jgi:outer membrane protein